MRLDCDKDKQQSLTHILVHDDLAVGAVTTMNALQVLMELPSSQGVLACSIEDLVRVDPRHRHQSRRSPWMRVQAEDHVIHRSEPTPLRGSRSYLPVLRSEALHGLAAYVKEEEEPLNG